MNGCFVFTGNLGGGKSLCAVGRIKEKLEEGCMVATNMDLNLVAMFGATAKNVRVMRVPDKPSLHDCQMIGVANASYDESKNGLLVLDECGTWFNSRNWQDKGRKAFNDWLVHVRKLGWDLILIVQHVDLLDSQARKAIAEHTAFCRRLDKVQVPFIGGIFKLITGKRLGGPRVHSVRVVYGTLPTDPLTECHVYRGNSLFSCYDTKQVYLDDYAHGTYSLLTPWHIKGRYQVVRDWSFFMRMTKIYYKRLKAPLALAAGSAVGVVIVVLLMQVLPLQAKESPAVIVPAQPIIESKPRINKVAVYVRSLIDSIVSYDGFYAESGKPVYLFSVIRGKQRVSITSHDLKHWGVVIQPMYDVVVLRYGMEEKVVHHHRQALDERQASVESSQGLPALF